MSEKKDKKRRIARRTNKAVCEGINDRLEKIENEKQTDEAITLKVTILDLYIPLILLGAG